MEFLCSSKQLKSRLTGNKFHQDQCHHVGRHGTWRLPEEGLTASGSFWKDEVGRICLGSQFSENPKVREMMGKKTRLHGGQNCVISNNR